ncbi:MAG: hypothetical protein K0R09_2052 [Clostridiales bacterium]|jgi:hypothetical protein|nr:hypothetical protein [Clostridiales bacterium]
MGEIIEFIARIGVMTIFVTPLTLIVGIVNAIKKPENESMPYTVMAVISAYLIIMPLFYLVIQG